MKTFITNDESTDDINDELRNFLLYEAGQERKGIALAWMVKTDSAKQFLERISGMKAWEKRAGSFVSPAIPRKEAYKLALKIPENLFSDNFIGIIKSSGEGYRVMLDLERVLNASPDGFYPAMNEHSEFDTIVVQWDQRPSCVVSQQMTWHKVLRLACKIDENLFFNQDQESVGIVKSSGGGFRLMLDPEKFRIFSNHSIFCSENKTKKEKP